MSSWSGKTRGGLTGYSIFVFFLKHTGLSFAYFLLYFVAGYFFVFYRNSFRFSYRYFHRIIKFSSFRSVFKIFRNYYLFGQVIVDRIALMAGYSKKLTFDFDGEEHLRKMVDEKTGGLLISAHIGNFEIAAHLLKRLNTKVNIVMLDAEHEKIKDFLSNIYLEKNVNIIAIKNDLSHIYALNNAFDNKEIVCLHGDRFIEGSETVKLPFMDHQARFPAGPFYIAMRYDIPVSFVFAMKEKKFHYHFYASPLKWYFQQHSNFKTRKTITENIIKEYILQVEKMLKKYPEQWFNYYNFWEDKK